MKKVELTEAQEAQVKKLMAQGRSKGEALVELGFYKKREIEVKDETPVVKKEKKARPVDAEKQGVLDAIHSLLVEEGYVVEDATTREVNFSIGANSYTVTVVKHKAAK